jgi:hypothetical protein
MDKRAKPPTSSTHRDGSDEHDAEGRCRGRSDLSLRAWDQKHQGRYRHDNERNAECVDACHGGRIGTIARTRLGHFGYPGRYGGKIATGSIQPAQAVVEREQEAGDQEIG